MRRSAADPGSGSWSSVVASLAGVAAGDVDERVSRDDPATADDDAEDERATRRRSGERWGVDRETWKRILTILGLLILVVLVFWVATVQNRRNDEADRTAATASDSTADGEPGVEEAGEPTLRIHPQRARVGSPLELATQGTGCGGRTATLSIMALGRASDTVGFDRLVVRRRVDVERDGTWATTPLLVGQPPGSYRVTAACERRAMLEGAEPPEGRRDVFVAGEALELTGPAVLYDLDVAPPEAPPGQAVAVRLSGRDQCPPGARVTGSVFPAAGAPGAARTFEAVVDAAARWTATVAIAARDAAGAYGVEARCSAGFAFATESLRFPVPDDDPVTPIEPVGPDSGHGVPGPATPIPGRPSYTG